MEDLKVVFLILRRIIINYNDKRHTNYVFCHKWISKDPSFTVSGKPEMKNEKLEKTKDNRYWILTLVLRSGMGATTILGMLESV